MGTASLRPGNITPTPYPPLPAFPMPGTLTRVHRMLFVRFLWNYAILRLVFGGFAAALSPSGGNAVLGLTPVGAIALVAFCGAVGILDCRWRRELPLLANLGTGIPEIFRLAVIAGTVVEIVVTVVTVVRAALA